MNEYAQIVFLFLSFSFLVGAFAFQVLNYFQNLRMERGTNSHLSGIIAAQEEDVRRASDLYRGALSDIGNLSQELSAHEAAGDLATGIIDDLMLENAALVAKNDRLFISNDDLEAHYDSVKGQVDRFREIAADANRHLSVIRTGALDKRTMARAMDYIGNTNQAIRKVAQSLPFVS